MKTNLLLVIILAISTSVTAQSTVSVRTRVNIGMGEQQNKLKNAYGIGGLYEKPFKGLNNLKFTAGADFGINGSKNMPYELKFNGSVTNTHIHYTSYVIQLASGLRYVVRDNKAWTPYVGLSAGVLNYYTSMSIADPADTDGCNPLDSRPVSHNMVLTGTTEAGIRIRPKQNGKGSIAYIEAGAAYIAGTRGKYLRLHNSDDHHHAEDSYMIKFRQGSTGIEHEHGVGTLYNTATSQLACHLAFVFRL